MLHEERQTRSAAVLPRTSGFLVRDIDRSGLGEAPAPLCSTGVSRSAHRREASYGIIRLKATAEPVEGASRLHPSDGSLPILRLPRFCARRQGVRRN
jgi:hypothetical protein